MRIDVAKLEGGWMKGHVCRSTADELYLVAPKVDLGNRHLVCPTDS